MYHTSLLRKRTIGRAVTISAMAVAGALFIGCRDNNPAGPTVIAPAITVHPADVQVTEGNAATFSVDATGTDPQYQWQENGSDIAGANSSGLTKTSVYTSDNGKKYRCIVRNSAGSDTSNEATLTVSLDVVAPRITVQPSNVTTAVGGTATFSLSATGTDLQYQWLRSGTTVPGASSPTYTKSTVSASDNGDVYTCIVSNSAGADTSAGASLFVLDYLIDTANVDYNGANNVVFFDFATGKKTILAHNTWHIAFDGSLNVIANSGNYGTGVAVCSTGTSDFGQDFTAWFGDTTKKFTRIDTNANVLGKNWMNSSSMPPTFTNQVFLLKTKGTSHYKVQFTGAAMGGTIRMKIGAPDAASADELTFTHNRDYEYTYIDCAGRTAVMVAPKRDSWDLRFGRTEFAMGAMTGGRSSIAINSAGGVQVAIVDGKNINEVPDASSLSFSTGMLAIGHEWYEFDQTTRVFNVPKRTHVIKTTGGNYAKLQIATFYGPGTPPAQFWSIFEYLYQSDGAERFVK